MSDEEEEVVNGEEEEVVDDDDDDDDDDEDLDEIRVALKPRCNILSTIKELRANSKVGAVEFDIYKNFLRDAVDDEVIALFDALGNAPSLKKLTIISKGSATQAIPVPYLSHVLLHASELRELRSMHIKWKGAHDDFEELALALGDHTSLRVLQLHVETMDNLEPAIAAAGHIPTLYEVDIHTANAAADKQGLVTALQSLCTSKSLRILKLTNVALKFEILSSMARLMAANTTLQELVIEASELDLQGGMAMAQMITANAGLHKFILKLDKMHKSKLGEEFIHALQTNTTLHCFQIILDGRMSDMKVVRDMQLLFRDSLKSTYKVSSQVGLSMGVTCERK